MRRSKSVFNSTPACIAAVLTVMLVASIFSACKQPEKPEPVIEYQLQYRILYDETLSGEDILYRVEMNDYDIVFFNEAQLSEAGKRVQAVARDRLAVFVGVPLNKANTYLQSDRFESCNDYDSAVSCYSVCTNSPSGETGIFGTFQDAYPSRIELIEQISKFWHERLSELNR